MGFIAQTAVAEKGRKEQREARRKQENMRRLQTARDNMAQVRQARIAQAQVLQGAATAGTMGSSAAQGGYSAIGSLTAGNMQFTNQIDSMNAAIFRNMEKANQYGNTANLMSQITNLALQGASMGGGGSTSPATPTQVAPQTTTVYGPPQ